MRTKVKLTVLVLAGFCVGAVPTFAQTPLDEEVTTSQAGDCPGPACQVSVSWGGCKRGGADIELECQSTEFDNIQCSDLPTFLKTLETSGIPQPADEAKALTDICTRP